MCERFSQVHAKSNLAPRQPSLTYALQEVPEFACCRIAWGGPSELTADDLCDTVSRKEKEEREERESKLEQALRFLGTVLASGPRAVAEVKEEGKLLGITPRTLERAAKTLGVSIGYPHLTASRLYEWELPARPKGAPELGELASAPASPETPAG